jgi:hypothetical protein
MNTLEKAIEDNKIVMDYLRMFRTILHEEASRVDAFLRNQLAGKQIIGPTKLGHDICNPDKARPDEANCPHYGKNVYGMDMQSNGCELIGNHSPCRYASLHLKGWQGCPIYLEEATKPDEAKPERRKGKNKLVVEKGAIVCKPNEPEAAEEFNQQWLAEQIGTGVHTMLRKALDSHEAHIAWKAIKNLNDGEWNVVVQRVAEAIWEHIPAENDGKHIEQLEAENKQLKTDLESGFMQGGYARLHCLQNKEGLYEQLKAALEKYGQHLPLCKYVKTQGIALCTCGLDKAKEQK